MPTMPTRRAARMWCFLATALLSASIVDVRAQDVFAPIEDDPALPRVLLLGDSISIGYTLGVRELLRGKCNVHRAPENCGPTTRGLERLDDWLGAGTWDVIHFNFGLHDLKYISDAGALVDSERGRQQVPPAAYERNLRQLLERLEKSGARLVWCATTPVPAGARGRIPGDAAKYNEIARRVVLDAGRGRIFINDLYAFSWPHLDAIQQRANVHFTPEGSRLLAEEVAAVIARHLAARAVEVEQLFDGTTLAGWEQLGGRARYAVEDGAIVGTAVPGTPNSFLATRKTYGDFILRVEFKAAPKLNSGIQIRSAVQRRDEDAPRSGGRRRPAGRVYGYQVEIDADVERGRLWSGGIYDEARRGWLDDLGDNERARAAFRPGEWNAFRIEAVGDTIRTWINEVPAARLVDSMTLGGFIALQVHGIGRNEERAGDQVRWRRLEIEDLGRSEWLPLFDGASLDGWSALAGGEWSVEGGAIVGRSTSEEKRHGLLISDATYGDFTVRLKFRALKGDSGLYFRAERVGGDVGVHGFQAEIEAGFETGGLYETGGRGWVVKPDEAEMKRRYRPGEWTDLAVSARGGRLVVHVNGHRTADVQNDAGRRQGHLALQLHGGQDMHVEFKGIELLRTP